MHMQLNEQFIVDEQGSKKAVIIPFANYLRIVDIIRQHDEPTATSSSSTPSPGNKSNAQAVKAWLASDQYRDYPIGNANQIENTVQEIRDAWGDE